MNAFVRFRERESPELFRICAVHRLGAEHVGKNLRVDADLIAAAAAVDEDVVELENRILNVDGHLLFRAEGRGAAHKVAGIPLRLFGLAGRNVLYADLAGEILGRDLAVAGMRMMRGFLFSSSITRVLMTW